MNHSPELDKLTAALVAAHAEFPALLKNKRVNAGAMRYAYIELPDILDAVKFPLAENGLVVTQSAMSSERGVGVTTRISHDSGQWLETDWLIMPLASNATPQQAGSAITYARRYSLTAALGIAADEDDDGASASKRPSAPASKSTEKQRRTSPQADTGTGTEAGEEEAIPLVAGGGCPVCGGSEFAPSPSGRFELCTKDGCTGRRKPAA